MKEPRPALENLCCLNAQCKTYGQRGQSNLRVRKVYGADRIRYLRCGCCGEEFSERKGTALFNGKIGEAQAVSVLEHLDSSCGRAYPVPRRSPRGRPPDPVVRIPQGLVYAQIVKHRQGGRVQQVEIRPIFGKGKLAQVVADLGWTKANTSAIERFNRTDRMRNARKARKTLRFSRRTDRHDALSWIGAVRYNFHHPHRSLRRQTEEGRWQQKKPALAAGIADHLYSSLELMRLCPVGLR